MTDLMLARFCCLMLLTCGALTDLAAEELSVDAKHFATKVFALLSIVGAGIFALLSLAAIAILAYNHAGDVWVFLSLIFSLGLAACLFSFGVRAFRWSGGLPPPRSAKVKWERVYIGYWVLFCLYLSYFRPSPYLRPEGSEKAPQGMLGVWVAMAILGSGLIITGMNLRFRKRNETGDLSR